ncbi:hypothetical protein XHV734_4442 [Xanthomonas hortorum pv. vitians]|nr:hypothetical protein XHV734_4442 [Xanthomonas hortorum pv. vitians]
MRSSSIVPADRELRKTGVCVGHGWFVFGGRGTFPRECAYVTNWLHPAAGVMNADSVA